MKIQNIAGLVLRLLAAAILLQTLGFKFGAHPESVALFTKFFKNQLKMSPSDFKKSALAE